ncbi:MAG TPA: hypothetical protein VGB24_10905 [Longimicrobium sp.]|jgi:hypothetical protein|uniref:hypothetical protein n=1 Tax=Longimicrobium sp. TaxID=2029185 RepID=UPI002EDA6CFF
MSDSPKYCSARLSREREEALRRERKHREAERRRAAEEKQRRERAARVERQQGRRTELARRCQALQAGAARAGAAPRLAALVATLDATGRALSAAGTDTEMTRQQVALDAAQTALVGLERDVVAAIAREERAELLRALQGQAGQVQARLAARFDAAGAQATAGALERLGVQLREGRFADFDRDRAEAGRLVARHADEVAGGHARWLAARDWGQALAGELTDAYRALQQDARDGGMPAARVASLEAAAGSLSQQLEAEAFEALVMGEASLRGELAAATAEVEEWLDRRARRETVLAALAEALPSLGFSIDPRSLDLAPPGEELTVLRAYRAGGGELGVTVGHDPEGGNEIYYEMEGFPHQEQRAGGTVVKTCDELEGLLETLHSAVRGQGVEVGELDWEGKPATRPDPHTAATAGTPQAVDSARSGGSAGSAG